VEISDQTIDAKTTRSGQIGKMLLLPEKIIQKHLNQTTNTLLQQSNLFLSFLT
jgi:hypothetical protein